ncbi:MAG TPA: hypothetical protein VEW48_23185 [Thermoanaerobaculia bacterium]|nr:hypothetical protein [Thermoanaerobaculia bacterium]
MNPKLLMMASALVLGLAGVAASFAPAELLTAWGSPATDQTVLVVQILGALYFSFALLNWTAKGVMIGGIYARPVSLGNFLHFTMGALALAKQELSHDLGVPIVVALVVYAVFAVLFGALVFGGVRQR